MSQQALFLSVVVIILLDTWHVAGQCPLAYLTVPLTYHKQTKTPHWSTALNLHHQLRKDLPGGFHDSWFTSFGRSLLPWIEVSANEAMTRNLCLTHKNIAESDAKVLAAQQKSLDSLAKVVDNNRIALDYLVTEQGAVYAVASTTW